MALTLAPSTVFARDYRVLRPLNEGGMGAVYVVEQISTGSQRALKLMHPNFVQDARMRQRFEQEARVGARIQSEHVVQVVAAGVDDASGYPFIVMELLQGEDLAAALRRRGAFGPAEVGHIFAQLCHALSAAHAAGVVHRDLKPENIFLAAAHREGASFVVKVLDFGIAKVAAEARNSSTAAMGTPLWMAPEQTAAHSQVSPQSDVWALGLIAFRMLTGRVYWTAANVDDASTAALMREIVLEPIVPASQRAAQLGVANLLPPGFDAWFDRCVNREAQARFANAGEVRAALSMLLGGALTPPPPQAAPMGAGTVPVGPAYPMSAAPTPAPAPAPAQYTIPGAPMGAAAAVPPAGPYAGMPLHTPTNTPPGVANTPPGYPVPPQPPRPTPPKKGGGAMIGALVGVGVILLGAGAFGVMRLSAGRARDTCERDAAEATQANASATLDACKRACADKVGEVCVSEGDLARRFKLGDQPEEAAKKAYDKACEADVTRGCRRAAELSERKDAAKAAELYQKACDKADGAACAALGAMLEQGNGVARDRMKALGLYDKSCQAGEQLACAYKAFVLAAGRGVKQDEAKAGELAAAAVPGLSTSCDHGEGRACVALAAILGTGLSGAKDETRAAQVEQRACDAGEPGGCAALGARTLTGAGVFKDAKKGAALLQQGCEGGEPAACTDLGMVEARVPFNLRWEVRGVPAFKLACSGIYGVGCSGWGAVHAAPEGTPADPAGAVAHSMKACDGGELVGCVNAGALYQYGVGAPRDRAKASELFKRACEGGDAGGCGELGTMYVTGRGVPYDPQKGVTFLQQACDWGERDACVVIADMKIAGVGTPKAPEEGVAMVRTFCEKGKMAMACNRLAMAMLQAQGMPKDAPGAVAMLKQVCDGKMERPYPDSCAALGAVYEQGMAGPKDFGAAAGYYKTACDKGSPDGCSGLAGLLAEGQGVPKDQARAVSMMDTACQANDRVACDRLGYFHVLAKAGLKANGAEGVRYLQMACDEGLSGSCMSIGLIYNLGLGGLPRDKAKALEYLKMACARGNDDACKKAKEVENPVVFAPPPKKSNWSH